MSTENIRAFPDPSEDSGIPVTVRKKTGAVYSILLAAFSAFLVVSVIAGGILGDIRHENHGYDDSGNLCGLQNERIEGVNHSGADMTEKRFLEIRMDVLGGAERRCVKTCKNGSGSSMVPRCRTTETRSEEEIQTSVYGAASFHVMFFWREIIGLCFLSMCLCGPLLIVLKLYPLVVLWTLLPLASVASVAWTTCYWISNTRKIRSSNNHSTGDLFEWTQDGTHVTTFMVVFFVVIIYHRNKMKLMATLFEECGRCIATMPALLLQPFQTLLSMAVLLCFLVVGVACLNTAGQLVADEPGRVTFKVHAFFKVTRWLLLFGFLWIRQFLLECQNMTVSGAVARWYFTRNKADLSRPVKTSFCTLFHYHLGSVAFGSVLLATVLIMSELANKSSRHKMIWLIVKPFLHFVHLCVQVLTNNAYVMIALYGEYFCRSARRSIDLLYANHSRVAPVEGMCYLFLLLVDLMAATVTAAFAYLLFKDVDSSEAGIPVGVVFLLSFLCCHCLSSVYEMTIDTFLLCFCVDCKENDGVTRPYYMGKRLEILLVDTGSNPIALAKKTDTTPKQASV